mmetsp:Transcript_12066/g.36642  ORF Transcript_12066/g.36642 Transcript_12066/m.36642 type:complete len:320 (+) Transcript_12066:113-1072(+)
MQRILDASLLRVPDLARLPWAHDHGIVVWLRNGPLVGKKLEVVLPEQHAHQDLDLHVRKGLPHAAVPAAPEPDEREGLLLVLLSARTKPVRVVGLRISVHAVQPVGERGGGANDVALGHVHLLALRGLSVEALVDVPHEHDQRRVQPEGLLHRPVQVIHLGQDVVVQLLAVLLDDVPLLLQDLRQELVPVLLGEQVQAGPRGGDARGVLAGKERGDEHAGDLVRGHLPPPVRGAVPRLHEGLQHVVLLVGVLGLGPPGLDDLHEDRAHLFPGPVPVPVGLDGQVREEHGDGLHSHVQEVELPVDLLEEILPDLSAEKAP